MGKNFGGIPVESRQLYYKSLSRLIDACGQYAHDLGTLEAITEGGSPELKSVVHKYYGGIPGLERKLRKSAEERQEALDCFNQWADIVGMDGPSDRVVDALTDSQSVRNSFRGKIGRFTKKEEIVLKTADQMLDEYEARSKK